MKLALDLPADLTRALKLRALKEGRKFNEAVTELLRTALSESPTIPTRNGRPKISTDPKTGLPVVKGKPGATISKMSSEEVYALIHSSQEEEDLARIGVSLRR
jgi:hypothetical protein